MAELEVLYDPELEVAAIINVETRSGWGPAMVGPNAKQLLTLFIESAPFDVSLLSSLDATEAFKSFLERSGVATAPDAGAGGEVAAEHDGATGMDAAGKAADAEAANASDVPPPQPADADLDAAGAGAQTVITCPNCNGTTTTNDGPDGTPITCGFCQGLGKVKSAA